MGVGPFALQDADQGLCLAVRLRASWSCSQVLESGAFGRFGKGVGAIAVAVVGEHALGVDAALGKPGEVLVERSLAVAGTLCRQHDGVRQAAVVVDHHVQVLPSRMPAAIPDIGAEHAFAWLPETSQPFDVKVDQSTWLGVLIALSVGPRLRSAAGDAATLEYPPDRRRRPAKQRRQPRRAPARAGTQLEDLLFGSDRQPPWAVLRDRRTIPQRVPSTRGESRQQPVGRRATRPADPRGISRRHPIQHQAHHPATRFPRVTHPSGRSTRQTSGPPGDRGVSATPRLPRGPDTLNRLAGS